MDAEMKLNASEMKASDVASERQPVPKDHYKFGYMTFMILGVATLLPWNSLIMALDFFAVKLPDHNVNFVVSILSNGPVFLTNVVMIILHRYYQSYIPPVKTSMISLFLMMLLCVCLPLLPQIVKEQSTEWVIVFIIIIVLSIVNGILGSLVNGIVGLFPRN
jgi:hypothetical protein